MSLAEPAPEGEPRRLSPETCRSLREELGWSPEQLASAAGVATLTVLAFEYGRRRPREETLIAIRRAFRKALGADVHLWPTLGAVINAGRQVLGSLEPACDA